MGEATKNIPRHLRNFGLMKAMMKAAPTHDELGRVQHMRPLTKDDRDWKERTVKIRRGEGETGDDAEEAYSLSSQAWLTLKCDVLSHSLPVIHSIPCTAHPTFLRLYILA